MFVFIQEKRCLFAEYEQNVQYIQLYMYIIYYFKIYIL